MAKNFSDVLAKIKADFKDAFVDVQLAGEIKGFPVESPSMNYIFGGKFATGRIYEIFGPESSGKKQYVPISQHRLKNIIKKEMLFSISIMKELLREIMQ